MSLYLVVAPENTFCDVTYIISMLNSIYRRRCNNRRRSNNYCFLKTQSITLNFSGGDLSSGSLIVG